MQSYLLLGEQKQINTLLEQADKQLHHTIKKELKSILTNIIKNKKDSSIEETLDYFTSLLISKMNSLLKNNLTLGLQFGIKNNYFEITSYGGKKDINTKENIMSDTLFSIDSISKVLTSIVTMQQIRNNNFNMKTPIHQINKTYNLDATIESILKFTAHIKTSKRLDNLTKEETISLLKECKENLTEKNKYKNFYEYNDIGYMILRQTIPNFLETLDILTNDNLTYNNQSRTNITGGKINEENITPDTKGRDIIFPGHTGIYSNITGLLNLFYSLLYTENILTDKEKKQLWTQPYMSPILYNENGTPKKANNSFQYTNKIAGIYKVPKGISFNYDKLFLFDIPNNTTQNAIASAGTCGSWITSDKLILNNQNNTYTAGILTNPYSFVETKEYPNKTNKLINTPLEVNNKGKIIGYSKTLNPYKEIIVNYALILELLTEYIRVTTPQTLPHIKIKKKINII